MFFFLTSVMSSCEVVSSVLFPRDKLLRMEKLTVRSGTDFIDNSRLQINEDGSGNMLSSTSLAEESVESVVRNTNRCITAQLTKKRRLLLDSSLNNKNGEIRLEDIYLGIMPSGWIPCSRQ